MRVMNEAREELAGKQCEPGLAYRTHPQSSRDVTATKVTHASVAYLGGSFKVFVPTIGDVAQSVPMNRLKRSAAFFANFKSA